MMLRMLPLVLALVASNVFGNGLKVPDQPQACSVSRLTFTMIPKKDIDEQIKEYQPLLELLRDGLGVPVDMVRASSYESVIDGIVSGAVDLAVMGPAAYVIAHERDRGVQAFASLAMEVGQFTPAGSFYYSALMVRSNGHIRTFEDLRGVRVALTDPSSTSGALIPKTEFVEDAGEPFTDLFGAAVYSGSHDKAMDALLLGKVDAAFVSTSRADEYVSRGVMEADAFRVLWVSSPLHYDPFVFRSRLCEPVRDRIAELLTEASPRLQAFLDSQHASAVTRVSHQDYQPIVSLTGH